MRTATKTSITLNNLKESITIDGVQTKRVRDKGQTYASEKALLPMEVIKYTNFAILLHKVSSQSNLPRQSGSIIFPPVFSFF